MEGLEGVCVCVCVVGEIVLIDVLLLCDEWKMVNVFGFVMDEMFIVRCLFYLCKLVNLIFLNVE